MTFTFEIGFGVGFVALAISGGWMLAAVYYIDKRYDK